MTTRLYMLALRFRWLVVPFVWLAHVFLHASGIAHTEGPWWWF